MEAKIIGIGDQVETYCLMVPHSKAREQVMGRVCIIIWQLVCQRDLCLRCSQLQAMQAHLFAQQGYVFFNLSQKPLKCYMKYYQNPPFISNSTE